MEYVKDLESIPLQFAHMFNDEEYQLRFHNKLLDDVINRNAQQKKRRTTWKQLPYTIGKLRKAINITSMLQTGINRYKTFQNFEHF